MAPAGGVAMHRVAMRGTRTRGIALGALLSCGLVALSTSMAFVGPSSYVRRAVEVCRGQEEPRTAMHAEPKKDPNFEFGLRLEEKLPRTRRVGGGRSPIYSTRKPAFGYAVAGAGENANSVLNRMRSMIDYQRVFFEQERQFNFRNGKSKRLWTRNFNFRMSRKNKLQRRKAASEDAWQQWLQTDGQKSGMTEAIVYTGPKVLEKVPLIESLANNDIEWKKNVYSFQEKISDNKLKKLWRKRARVPEDVKPGKWIEEGPMNIFSIFKRPLHKWPYDLPMPNGHVHRGNVF